MTTLRSITAATCVALLLAVATAGPSSSVSVSGGGGGSVSIGSFNLCVFGQTKSKKPEVMQYLVDILSRYDVVAVQEIRDAAGTAFPELMTQLNAATNNAYSSVVGPREGRTSSKEQYAFVFATATLELTRTYRYDDRNDTFERPPFAAEFVMRHAPADTPRLVLVDVHTKPEAAVEEVEGLASVYGAVSDHFGTPNVLTVGDYNCGCSYVTKTDYPKIWFYTDTARWHWFIPNTAKTMVHTDCPYDRIVSGGDWLLSALDPASAGPFDFPSYYRLSEEKALEVSDHLPVTITLRYGNALNATASANATAPVAPMPIVIQ